MGYLRRFLKMDYLVVENYLLAKTEQPEKPDDRAWMQEFGLD